MSRICIIRRLLLGILNIAFSLAALGILLVSLLCLIIHYCFLEFFGITSSFLNLFLMIAVGILFLIIGIIGFFAAQKLRSDITKIYIFLLLSIIIGQWLFLVVLVVQRTFYYESTMSWFRKIIMTKYLNNSKESLDQFQQTYQCCGYNSSEDWKQSQWYRSRSTQYHLPYPPSCCLYPDVCWYKNDSDIFHKGCAKAFQDFMNKNWYFQLTVIIFLFWQIVMIILACIFLKQCVKKQQMLLDQLSNLTSGQNDLSESKINDDIKTDNEKHKNVCCFNRRKAKLPMTKINSDQLTMKNDQQDHLILPETVSQLKAKLPDKYYEKGKSQNTSKSIKQLPRIPSFEFKKPENWGGHSQHLLRNMTSESDKSELVCLDPTGCELYRSNLSKQSENYRNYQHARPQNTAETIQIKSGMQTDTNNICDQSVISYVDDYCFVYQR